MAIINEPVVHIVGRQQVDDSAVHDFLEQHGASWETDSEVGGELLSELGGRVCYMAFGAKQGRRTNKEYLGNILKQRHGSVLEHAVWTFLISGVSRSLTHELIRHRAGWAFSQLSQRYVDEAETDFVEPSIIAGDPRLHEMWLEAIEATRQSYMALSARLAETLKAGHPELSVTARRKAARQAARSVLPNATETKIVVTANGRALRHFIELRGSEDAEPEIRALAVGLLRALQAEAPNMFGDFTLRPLYDGSYATEVEHSKV